MKAPQQPKSSKLTSVKTHTHTADQPINFSKAVKLVGAQNPRGTTHGAGNAGASADAGAGLFSFLGIRTTKDASSDGEDCNRSAGLKGIQPLEELEAVRRETEMCAVEASRSKDIHDLIRRLLATDTEERLTAAEAIAHPALATSVFRNPFL